MTSEFEPTQLRELYDALGALKEGERTALAEMHANDPTLLLHRFEHSVKKVAGYPPLDEHFHPPRSARTDPPTSVAEITSTADFARHLSQGNEFEVGGDEELWFRFVDREIFPLRQTTRGGTRPTRRWLDLLLVSRDGLPIVAELKIREDKPTYDAFIQALMYAVELSSPAQLSRLKEQYEEAGFDWPTGGPVLDLYLIAFDPPVRGTYRKRSFEATKRIVEKMLADERLSSVVRRIAYLEATIRGDGLAFKSRFCFGRGDSP
jgi:hypothetical protein